MTVLLDERGSARSEMARCRLLRHAWEPFNPSAHRTSFGFKAASPEGAALTAAHEMASTTTPAVSERAEPRSSRAQAPPEPVSAASARNGKGVSA